MTAAALALACFNMGFAPLAVAAAPMVKTQAPGYYRMMLGDFEITALSDGTFSMTRPDELLINTTPAAVNQALANAYLSDPVETSVNAFLINTGSKLILIDSGAGTLFGPTLGKLVANLKASGYQPEQVDQIYITHMHADHLGGLVSGGNPAFPNAIVRADKSDADFWLSQKNLDAASADAKSSFQSAVAAIGPYAKAGHFQPFEGDAELVPGIRPIATHGHTAGHSCYLVESKGQKLIVLGDLIHVAAVQFANPPVALKYDSDPKTAAAARERIFADAAKQGILLAGAHLSFPGLGHLRSQGKGYLWIPANYTIPGQP